jgi:DegV family protein with EDD domain
MSKVAIVTDSTAYIPEDVRAGLPIYVTPLQLIWDQESFRDGIDIQPVDFYTRLSGSKTMPSTSQTTPAYFLQLYQQLITEGYEIVSIHISSLLSGTLDSAIQAKAQIENGRIELVDSKTSGMALGFQALQAARAAANGASVDEVKAIAEKAVDTTGVYFLVDTLEFLHRGGRIGGGAAFIGKLLDMKPILAVRHGKIEAADKARTRNKALERLVHHVVTDIGDRRPIRIGVVHANAAELAAEVLEKVCQQYPREDVVETVITDVSPVIGTHIGPGGTGVCFMAGM